MERTGHGPWRRIVRAVLGLGLVLAAAFTALTAGAAASGSPGGGVQECALGVHAVYPFNSC
ncbi:MAG TPA: hypothetical protein VGD67_29015 [Pseudonocardiaceae bacterium]